MIYRPRSYATYLPRHRRPIFVGTLDLDARSLASCACRSGERICPLHAPNLYTLGGAAHRAVVTT